MEYLINVCKFRGKEGDRSGYVEANADKLLKAAAQHIPVMAPNALLRTLQGASPAAMRAFQVLQSENVGVFLYLRLQEVFSFTISLLEQWTGTLALYQTRLYIALSTGGQVSRNTISTDSIDKLQASSSEPQELGG